MNHIYRLCWNRTLRACVAASELAKGRGTGTTGRSRAAAAASLRLGLLAWSLGMCGLAWAGNAPTGGQIVAGSGQVTQSGNVTTIKQNSGLLSLNWQSFDVGADQTVNFLQPGSDSIAVNRVLGNTASGIYGHLNANGQVWLINPNGVLFGQGAQVDVGGIVASTLDLDDGTLGTGKVRFAGNGRGSVVNQGSITAAPGGYVALLGNTVSNQGTIRAQLGTVALGGGTAMTLTFDGSRLMRLVVDANTVKSLVENRQLVVADGGQVLMTAGARASLIDSAVNNTGIVQARTVSEHNGTITLLAGMRAGTANVGGTLDASAPDGGNGGFIETSGAHAHIADGATITTSAADGQSGTWLIDPTDFTIAASGGDITGSTLSSQLAAGNVSFSSSDGSGGTAGNVTINDAVSWSANTTLTLTASNNVVINGSGSVTNTGANAKTVLNAGNAFVNNAGAAALGGHWAIYSASPTAAGAKLGGLAPGFIQYNAPQGTAAAAGATGNGLFYASAAAINITGFNGTPTKGYDGTTNLLVGNLAYGLAGGGSGDALNAITGGYSQSDVGSGLTVKAPTAGSAYSIVNGGILVFGYTVSGAGSASVTNGSITPAVLGISIVGPDVDAGAYSLSKVYDGTNSITLNAANYRITGVAAGERITVNQPSQVGYGTIGGGTITAIADVNTEGGTIPAGGGGAVPISAIFTSTNFSAGAGTKLSNYNLTGLTATGTGAITQAPVYLSGVMAQNKTYDTGSDDPLNVSNASIYGIVNGDAVTLDTSAASGSFADANAGNGKAVTLGGFVLTGSDPTKVADYNLILPTNLTATIAKAPLSVFGVTVDNKVYDGSTLTTAGELDLGGASFIGSQGSDSLTLDQTGAVGHFSQADVGSGLAVTVGGLAVRNSDNSINSNYVVSSVQGGTSASPTALMADITPRPLTITFNGSADKIYDGTNYATLVTGNFTVSNVVSGESVTVGQAPAVYTGPDASNVGTDQVTAELQSSDLDFAGGAKAGNYTFNTTVVGTGKINPAPLSLVIVGNPSKPYDGTSTAALTAGNFRLDGVMPGESINLVGPFAADYYNGSPSTPESNAGTWGVTASLGTGNYAFTPSTINPTGTLSNYILPAAVFGFGSITPVGITSQITAGINGADKVYDGNTSITLGSSNIVFNGFLPADSVTSTAVGPIDGIFATKDVGVQPLTALLNNSNISFTCGGGGTGCLGNYTYDGTAPSPGHSLADPGWSITAYGAGEILPKNLYITLTGVTKTYDGNTTVLPLSNGNFDVYGYADNNTGGAVDGGWVAGEGATITPTASFTYGSPNVSRDGGGVVQSDINVKGMLTWNNYAPTGATQLSNYNLVYAIDQNVGQITPAPLYVNGVYAQDKIYDGGNGALVNIANGQLAGLADVDKNGSAITLSIGNGTASTADGISGSTGGTLVPNGSGFTTTGSPVSGTFAGTNAGNGQAVSTVFSLGGSSAGNYTLLTPSLTADIKQRPLTVTGISANDKTYDGTTAVTFTFTTPTFNAESGTGSSVAGLLAADVGMVSVDQSSGAASAFATANANADTGGTFLNPGGSRITVTASGLSLNGSAAGNYVLTQPSGLSANILQKQITLSLVGPIQKVYDGSASITIPKGNDQSAGSASVGYHTDGWAAGEGAVITQTHSASYADTNASVNGGTNITVDGLIDVTAHLVTSDWQPNAGTALSNYALPDTVSGRVGQITPLVLDLSATRVYDATANIYASLAGNVTNADNANVFGTLNGLNGDQFTVTGTGTAASKNVGTYTNGAGFGLGTLALVSVSGDTNNYTLVGGVDSYTITKAPLDINGGSVNQKVYDGNTNATVAGASLTAGSTKGDVLGGDDVSLNKDGDGNIAGTFDNKNVGAGKKVTINGGAITGADAGNYQLVQPTGLTGTVTPRPVTVDGSRQYDGTTGVTGSSSAITWLTPGAVSGNADSGVVGGDTVKVNGGTGSVQYANVGTYHSDSSGAGAFDASGLTLSNANYMVAASGNQFTITPHVIELDGTRVYDGSTDAAATLFAGTSCGADCVTIAGVGGETLDLSGTGTLSSADVAGPSGAPIRVAFDSGVGSPFGFILTGNAGGAQASNYALAGGVIITPYVLGFSGTRTYDGTTKVNAGDLVDATAGSATAGTATFSGLGGDQFTLGGTGTLSSANAGSYGGAASGVGGTPSGTTQIGVNGLTLNALGGAKTSNYTLVGGNDSYDVTQATVTLTGIRQYDGLTGANGGTVIGGTSDTCTAGTTCWVVNGVLASDQSKLTVTGSGSIQYADVGSYGNGGAGGTFASTGLTLGGAAAGNYMWVPSTGDEFIVTPYVLNLAGTRVYDGGKTADASLFGSSGVLNGANGETVALTGSGTLSGKDVNGGTPYNGTGIDGATSGQGFNLDTLALASGGTGKASNYTLVGGADTLTITPKAITVDATAADKTYDGTTTATVTGLTSAGVVVGDTVNFANTVADFDDKNAGSGKTVTVDGINASGIDAGNYTINTSATTTADITKKVLDLSGTRVYDATTGASASLFGNQDGTINGVTVAGVTEVLNLAGSGVAGSADVATYARNPGSTTAPAAGSTDFGLGSLSLGDGAGINGGLASNYTLVGGNDSFTITPAGIALAVTIAGGRQYDGTTVALGTDFGDHGVITTSLGETLDLSGTGTLSSANVGTYTKSGGSLAFGSIALQDGTGAGAGKASNYTLTDGSFTVTQRVLDLGGSRVYDRGTDVAAGDLAIGVAGLVGGETLGLSGTGVLSAKDVNGGTPYTGTGIAGATVGQGFNLGTLALTDGTGLASNYTLVGGADTFTLTPLAITVAATAADKPYDGSTTATVTSLTSGGVIAGDTVDFDYATADFADANAGIGKTVTAGGITATGTDAGNYTFNITATTTADITPKVLDLTGTRVYDATADAAAGRLALGGLVGGETLVLSGLGQVSSKNVGNYTGGDFNLGTLTLADGSGLAGNYTLAGGIDVLTITPAPLTVSGVTAASKTYDGSTATTVSGGTLHGVIGGDNVTLSVGGTGTFATPNAGTGIAVGTQVSIGGADAGNYTLTQPGGVVADIYRKVLDLAGTRIYDGGTDAKAGDLAIVGGLVGHETLVLSGTGAVGDKNVDTDKALTSLGTLALADGGNGGLASNYTLVGGTDTLTITPKTITVDATGTDKEYDGGTPDTVTLAGNGLVAGDLVGLGYGEAHFDDPAVGNGKRVTVTGVTLSGDDARNYLLADPTVYTQANITGADTPPPQPPSGAGVDNGVLAQLGSVLGPAELATPYGLAAQDTVGPYTGNKKRLHHPVERNVSRDDFTSGLALKVVDGGVRVPGEARP